jgi:hypothetical protein
VYAPSQLQAGAPGRGFRPDMALPTDTALQLYVVVLIACVFCALYIRCLVVSAVLFLIYVIPAS